MKLVNKACSMYNKQPMVIKVLLVLAIASVLCCVTSCRLLSLESFSNPVKAVYYFHMESCGHCIKFNPVWDKFVASMDGSGITLKKFNQQEATALRAQMAKAGEVPAPTVSGYPTVYKSDGTDYEEFNDDRTVAALTAWVK